MFIILTLYIVSGGVDLNRAILIFVQLGCYLLNATKEQVDCLDKGNGKLVIYTRVATVFDGSNDGLATRAGHSNSASCCTG